MRQPKVSLTLLLVASFAGACGADERPPPEAPPLHQRPADDSPVVEARYFTIDTEDGVAAAEDRAEMLSALARQPGTNFGEIARHYTGGAPNRIRFERASVPDEHAALAEAVFALRVGEVSRPVRTPDGFIVALREPNPQVGPSQVGARHILIMHVDSERAPDTVTRTRAEAQTLAQDLAERAKGGEDWESLHAEHTDEPGSPPGGDLGTFERGQMVPAFEAAVWSMEVGAISDPIETPFGFHVIQRTR